MTAADRARLARLGIRFQEPVPPPRASTPRAVKPRCQRVRICDIPCLLARVRERARRRNGRNGCRYEETVRGRAEAKKSVDDL